jgi:DNA gyrase/topoisomerase IV subunit B
MNTKYSAVDIEVLEGLDPVRKRPGMYIGGTEGAEGLHHLVKEILDNSIDEAMNGHAKSITVVLHKDHKSVSVEDDGRGIPVDTHPKFKKSALELILTTLHAGGKFSDRNYVSAGGLHGVGASVVNALSSELKATVWREGQAYEQSFSQGKPTGALKKKGQSTKRGTLIFFRPDEEIFRNPVFSSALIEEIVLEKAFLNKGLAIEYRDELTNSSKKFLYKDGIHGYFKEIVVAQKIKPVAEELFYFTKTDENGVKVELSFCWTDSISTRVLSYVNGIRTGSGGTHEDGMKSGLGKAIRNYLGVHDITPKGLKVGVEDIREGLMAYLSVVIPGSVAQLQFQGQTKDKLNNPEAAVPVEALVKGFENNLNERPSVANAIMERIFLAAKARAAARSASESVSRKVGIAQRLNLPGKLADCSSKKPRDCELFIVEGDSAGGSAKQGRDRNIQAVMPLRGKILNSISSTEAKVKENTELTDLVSVLGCGMGKNINLDKLRYGKVVILTDADADGMHIATLLMAFFYCFLKPLVESGNLYIGMSPLYRIRKTGAKGEDIWVYSDEEKEKALKQINTKSEIHITRFKGLGEMNPKTLWETTLNPKTRKLLRVTIDDDNKSRSMFDDLLGKDSAPRYKLIQQNAHRLEIDL